MIRTIGKINSSLEPEFLKNKFIMKKYTLLLIFILYSSLSYGQSYGIMSNDTNSRRTANRGEILRVISKGQKIEILQTQKGWSFVKDLSNGKKGWVSARLINKNIAILKTDANSRRTAGGKKLRVILKGQLVEILIYKAGWSFVRDIRNGKKGWVANSVLSKNVNSSAKNPVVVKKPKNISTKNVSRNTNNSNSSEQIIENRLSKMGIKWKWDAFKKGIKSDKISIPNVEDFLLEVKSYMGVPYKYSGTTRSGIDCSGLIWKGLRASDSNYNGERLNAQSLAQSGKLIANKSSLRAGDLVCFTNTTGANKLVQHIAIYVGNNQFLHAPSKGKNVMLSDLNDPYYWGNKFVFGVRF